MPRKHTDLAVPSGGPTVSATLTMEPSEFLVSIQVSATYDGTAITITGNTDGSSTLVPLKDSFGNAVVITSVSNVANIYYVPMAATLGLTRVAFTSGTAQGIAETLRATTWIER